MNLARAIASLFAPVYPQPIAFSPVFSIKLGGATVLMVAIATLSVNTWLGRPFPVPHEAYVTTALALLVQIILGIPLYTWIGTHPRQNGGKIAVALAALVAFTLPFWQGIDTAYRAFFTTASLTLFVTSLLIYLEYRFLDKTSSASDIFNKDLPNQVTKTDGQTLAITSLRTGDVIQVKAGQKIPRDGIIVSGTTSVDESPLTGDSRPLLKEKGDEVVGGTLNRDGDIIVEVTREEKETIVNEIMACVEQIQKKQFPLTGRLENYSKSLSFFGIIVALIGAFYYFFVSPLPLYQVSAIALATLISFSAVSITPAAWIMTHIWLRQTLRRGILLKDPRALDYLGRLELLFFDKTGTITKGNLEYSQSFIELGTNQGRFLSTVFSLEAQSDHPFARAVETHPWYNEIIKHPVRDFKVHPGLGLCGTVQPKGEREYFAAIGNLRFLKRMQMMISRDMKTKLDELEAMGDTVLLCGYGRTVVGLISFSDTLRPGVPETLQTIRKMGIEPAIITGDSVEALERLAKSLGIKKVFPRCTPDEKAAKVAREKNAGRIIGFVGKKTNKEAIEKAHVSVTIDTGTNIKNQAATILVMASDFGLISWLVGTAKEFKKTVGLNLVLYTIFVAGFAALALARQVTPELVTSLVLILNLFILKTGLRHHRRST